MHVLDAGGAAVGVAQAVEDRAQGGALGAAQAAGGEGAVQVPQAQSVGGDVQVRVAAQAVGERVGVRGQVPALTEGVDELGHARRLAGLQLRIVGGVAHPLDRLEGDAQGLEGPAPETVQPQELALHQAQELARGGALDDAVVVGGGQGDDLADALAGQGVGAGAGEGRRVVHASHPHDESLAGHEAGHRVQGADHAGVGQGHGGAAEVVEVQLVLAGLGHEALIGLHEPGQVHEVGLLDGGHQQAALPVGAGHVDGQAEGHVGWLVQDRLAGLVDPVGDIHRGHLGQGLDHRPADEVGEGDLAAAGAGQVGVDDGAVLNEDLGGYGPGGGGSGHGQGIVHVLGGAGRRTLEPGSAVLVGVTVLVVSGVGGLALGVGGGRGCGVRRRGRRKVGAGDVLDRGGAALEDGGLRRDGRPARPSGG